MPARAPRKLVESRFRKDVGDQVKMSLLMDSMTQISEDGSLSPISEPDFDPVAVSIPEDGPMIFEFDIEVRPEFELPKWQGLSIERSTHEFTDAEVDKQLKDLLARRGRLVPFDGAAQVGDYVTVNLTFKNADGSDVSSAKEETIRIRPVLSFRDGKVERFDKLMKGVKAGETREGEAKLSEDAPNESLRGKTIKAAFEVLEVRKLELPQLTPAMLEELGGFCIRGRAARGGERAARAPHAVRAAAPGPRAGFGGADGRGRLGSSARDVASASAARAGAERA